MNNDVEFTRTTSFNEMLGFVNHIEKNKPSFHRTTHIHFLRNFTIEPIEPFLKFYLYSAHINVHITYSDYDAIHTEILNSDSTLILEQPEFVVLSLFYHVNDLFSHSQYQNLSDLKNYVITLYESLIEKTKSLILINTFIPSSHGTLIQHSADIDGLPAVYEQLNYFINEFASAHASRIILLDWNKYVRLLSEEKSIDHRYWYMNKAPFKKEFLNQYAVDISNIVKLVKGQIKKCLILDCDNTLWGGIIGEDGLEKIKLDYYEYPGKIYYDFQQRIINLYNRGILIVLCSKNNAEDVWNVLDNHPASLLKREHIAAHKINWNDKATNIKEIAEELNLGFDSLVFIDDSAFECGLVSKFIPEITVLQVPKELYLLPQLLLKNKIFESLNINEADKKRTLSYQQEQLRRTSAQQFVDIEEYLKSLNLKLNIHIAKDSEFARIAQLTQKTNQFNLSLKRYTEKEIQQFSQCENTKIFSLWTSDKFGDYGLTGVFIAKNNSNHIYIDSFLQSCRILSKRIEYAFFTYCFEQLKSAWDITTNCYTDYFQTQRNGQIFQFLQMLGFRKMNEKDNFHEYELNQLSLLPNFNFIQINEGKHS